MKTKETLYIYVRGHHNSVWAQTCCGMKKAKLLGMDFEILSEPNSPVQKASFDKVVHCCKKGNIKHLFVTSLDRITRDAAELKIFLTMIEAQGITLYTLPTVRVGNNSSDDDVHS